MSLEMDEAIFEDLASANLFGEKTASLSPFQWEPSFDPTPCHNLKNISFITGKKILTQMLNRFFL